MRSSASFKLEAETQGYGEKIGWPIRYGPYHMGNFNPDSGITYTV